MMNFDRYGDLSMFGEYLGGLMGVLFVLAIIDTALKGWAMWRAARMNTLPWFIALLVFNTLGILPTVFLLMTNRTYKEKFASRR